MKTIHALPLTAASFQMFGDVFEIPRDYGRTYVSDALANGRANARASLSVIRVRPLAEPTLVATKMERHEFSSQSFLPLDVARYLVIVAPMSAAGLPDEARLQAFLARGDQGVTYRMNVWHHPLTVLDRDAAFAITMWLEQGSTTDEEFIDLATEIAISF